MRLDGSGAVVVDAEPAVRALTYMRDAIQERGVVPQAVLAWQEEQSRFAFQNGQAAFMRNWPYAYPLMQDRDASQVAGRFGVAPMPATPDGVATAALGGSQLAINTQSQQPEAAYALIAFLTAPEQMLERAREVGQYPTRTALFDTPELARALPVPLAEARRVIESALPRPVSPVYAEMSDILQIRLHRVLTRQQEPRPALEEAADAIRKLLADSGLAEGP